MAKLKTDVIDKATMQKYLAENDDFAFELRCLHELQKRHALTISHGGTYSDPITNKSRQFDFRISFVRDDRHIALAAECKNLKSNFPLLISRLPRLKSEAFHQILIEHPARRADRERKSDFGFPSFTSASLNLISSEAESIFSPESLYVEKEMVGKSTVQVGRQISGELHGDDSEVHEKWAQALSSAHDLISDAAHLFSNEGNSVAACFILPVVVVPDGMLWVVDYSSKGDVITEPKATDETAFFLDHSSWSRGQMFSYTISHLHFVTLSGLASLVDRLLVNDHFVESLFPANRT